MNRAQPEVGDYFLDSILSDLDSLVLFPVLSNLLWIHRMLSKYPLASYEVKDERILRFMRFEICGAILVGFGSNSGEKIDWELRYYASV